MQFQSLFRVKSIAQANLEAEEKSNGMVRTLTQRDLILMGIAAIIGAGIFSTIGTACYAGGPAVSLLFVFTAIACVFSALCYAEFASTVPISGSAYTYAYTTLGEMVAWVLGWNLIFEYVIGNVTVGISWSKYFQNLLSGLGWQLPPNLGTDYFSAHRAFLESAKSLEAGTAISADIMRLAEAWQIAPQILGLRIIFDLPVMLITVFITWLIIKGIKESKRLTNYMVVVKLIVVVAVILIGVFYVNIKNWTPFAPNGLAGIMKGVSSVFFAFIGFDAISTTAEECKNPQRDLPKAMIKTLLICTILYVLLTLVLTGMVSYKQLNVADPLAHVFGLIGLQKLQWIIAVSAVAAMTSVFLVFQIGQPRIWMAMSRDGLLPKRFSSLHPKYKTPAFSSIVAGFLVAIPALFFNINEVTDLCSMGTLFAFALVSAGVLVLQERRKNGAETKAGFRVPHISGTLVVPMLLMAFLIIRLPHEREGWENALKMGIALPSYLYAKLPSLLFVSTFVVVSYFTIRRRWSLIPVLGVLTNVYLMSELSTLNWLRFLGWCAIGLVVYFLYSRRHSNLNSVPL